MLCCLANRWCGFYRAGHIRSDHRVRARWCKNFLMEKQSRMRAMIEIDCCACGQTSSCNTIDLPLLREHSTRRTTDSFPQQTDKIRVSKWTTCLFDSSSTRQSDTTVSRNDTVLQEDKACDRRLGDMEAKVVVIPAFAVECECRVSGQRTEYLSTVTEKVVTACGRNASPPASSSCSGTSNRGGVDRPTLAPRPRRFRSLSLPQEAQRIQPD